MGVKNVSWSNLKKVSGADVRHTEAAWGLFPSVVSRENIALSIRKMLMKHLGEKAFYYLDGVETLSSRDFLAKLPESSVSAVIGGGGDGRLMAHIDSNLAFLVIDKLLGGSGPAAVENRPLSETEEGVLQYFVLQILFSIWHACREEEKVHFRFERFASLREDALNVFPKNEGLIVFFFKVGIGERSGFVRIAVSGTLLDRIKFVSSAVKDKKELEKYFDDLSKFHFVRTSIWAEAGRATLSSRELAQLEDGDVILFDECGIQLRDKKAEGEVQLKVGTGEHGFVRASVTTDAGTLRCKIL